MSERPILSVRFDTRKLLDALKKIARDENRSLNFIINKACEEFIERRAKP